MPPRPTPARPERDHRERDHGIEWIRASCILYIVGFWHLLGYAPAIDGYKNAVTTRLTVVVLGLFLFVSGHLIRRTARAGRGFVASFYRRRLLRIYPPYLVALLLFESCGLLERGQFWQAGLLVSAFTDNSPLTLWFITVLVVYVVVAPFVLLLRQRLNPGAGAAGDLGLLLGLVLLTVLLAELIDGPDPRLFLYLPPFLAGLLAPAPGRLLATGLACAGGVAWSVAAGEASESGMDQMPMVLFGSWFVFLLVERIVGRRQSAPAIVLAVAFASYFTYLLHRPVFWWLLRQWEDPDSAAGQLAGLLLICLPVTLVVAWLAQTGYDRLVSKLRVQSPIGTGR